MAVRSCTVACLACAHDSVLAPPEAAYTLSVAGGDQQRGAAGSVLPQPLSVSVRDASGSPVKDAHVVFQVQRGEATGSHVLDSIAVTSPAGIATAWLQLGSALDTTVVTAYPAPAIERVVTMRAVATAAPVLTAVSPATFASLDTVTILGTGLSLAGAGATIQFGGVPAPPLPGATDGALRVVVPACLAPGTVAVRLTAGLFQSNSVAGTYLSRTAAVSIAPFQALTVTSAQLADCLTLDGDGTSYLVVAEYASEGPATLVDWRLGAGGPTAGIVATRAPLRPSGDNPQRRHFEALLRNRERVNAMMARTAAPAEGRAGPHFQVAPAPPALGSMRTFHAAAAVDLSSFTDIATRLMYAGDHLLVYVDTVGAGLSGNGTGFSDAQYRTLGTLFDHDLYPIAAGAFGSESDLDGNGRVIAVFTPAVNRLITSTTCSQNGFVTGFFNSNDLLVQDAGSNKGELFFSYIPDSLGTFSCPHTATDVLRILPGTFIHELQHMISFNQHVLARAGDVEDSWLNEGLSHIAEELASEYYEAKFPPPSGRTSTLQLFPDSAGPFMAPQLFNAYVWMTNTRVHSVTSYIAEGSLEDRGATWLFLRWLAAQKGEGVFGRLVQTSRTGIANVEDKAGEPFSALFGDFSLALYTDSIPGLPRAAVPPRYQFGSRDLRVLMAREAVISGFTDEFPLPLFPLRFGGFLQSQMEPGTMTHTVVQPQAGSGPLVLRFTHQDLTAFAPALGAQVSIFRLPP